MVDRKKAGLLVDSRPWVAVPIPGGQHLSVRAGSLVRTREGEFGFAEVDGLQIVGSSLIRWDDDGQWHDDSGLLITEVYSKNWGNR